MQKELHARYNLRKHLNTQYDTQLHSLAIINFNVVKTWCYEHFLSLFASSR